MKLQFKLILFILLFFSLPFKSSSQAFLVNDDQVGDCFQNKPPEIAMNSQGAYVIVWRDERNGDFDMFLQRYDSSGQPIGSNVRVNDDNYLDNPGWTDHTDPHVAMNDSGRVIVTWADRRAGYFDIWAQLFDQNGNKIGNNFMVNDEGSPNTYNDHPVAAIGPAGNFVIAWNDNRESDDDVFAQRFDATGNPLGANVKVNTDGETEYGQYPPGIGIADNGDFVITWADNRRSGEADVYYQRYSSSGVALGANMLANDTSLAIPEKRSTLAMNGNGNFVIVWDDYSSFNPSDPDVMAQRFSPTGAKIGTSFKVNDDATTEAQQGVDVAINDNGHFIISWIDNRIDNFFGDIYAQRYDQNGIAIGSNFLGDDFGGSGMQEYARCAISNAGGFVLTWSNSKTNTDILAINYDNQGQVSGASYTVNDDIGSGKQIVPATAMNENGDFVIVWEDYRDDYRGEVYLQRYDNAAHQLGANVKVNTDNGYYNYTLSPAVAMNNTGQFIVAWTDRRSTNCPELYVQRYDQFGLAIDTNQSVEDGNCTYQEYPAIALADDGSFVVAWYDDRDQSDIYARMFSPSGTAIGSSWKVNDDAVQKNQYAPAIAMDSSNNFVIVWQDERSYGKEIYAQRYSSNGTAIGPNFKVSTRNNTYKYSCDVAMDKAGNFAIVWIDEPLNELNPSVMLQYFENNGTALDSNIIINQNTDTSAREFPSITFDPEGSRFLISWTDYRNALNPDMYGLIFKPGFQLDTNFRISDQDAFENNFQVTETRSLACNHHLIIATWQDNLRHKQWDVYGKLMDWSMQSVGIDKDQPSSDVPGISVFPNPATTFINIKSDAEGTLDLRLYNILGATVLNEKLDGGIVNTFDINHLPGGIYFLCISTNSSQAVSKLIISK